MMMTVIQNGVFSDLQKSYSDTRGSGTSLRTPGGPFMLFMKDCLTMFSSETLVFPISTILCIFAYSVVAIVFYIDG